MKKYILPGVGGFVLHWILLVGNPNTASSRLNLYWIYDWLGNINKNNTEIGLVLGSILISATLGAILFIALRIFSKADKHAIIIASTSFAAGSILSFLSAWLLIWLVWKDFSGL